MRKIIIIIAMLQVTLAWNGITGRSVYVSTSGNDLNQGTIESPLGSITRGITLISEGDTCFIRGGTYREVVSINDKNGSQDFPAVIMSYRNERVLLDGTIMIEGDWERHNQNIWKIRLSQDIWQLFHNDFWMMMARWPNASFREGTIWDQQGTWVSGDPTYDNGTYSMIPGGDQDPSKLGFSLEDALAILNVGSFRTYTRKILEHHKGDRNFQYVPVPRSGYRSKKHFVYFEGKLDFLDTENEWYYDLETKILYAFFPGGDAPLYPVKGKVQTYALSFSDCSFLKIDGLDFFASTVSFDDCHHVIMENCNFNFLAFSKRMLGDTGLILTTSFANSRDSVITSHIIRNCTFKNTDGCALVVQGDYNLLENCLFKNIDISCSEIPGIGVSIMFTGMNNIIRRNTIKNCGASETLSPGAEAIVELNSISRTGMLQSDGALIHCMKPEQPGVEIAYNWCFDSEKYGIRFDGKPASTRGLVHHNVVWNVGGGYQLKGDFHKVYNNTGFRSREKCDFISLSEAVYGGNMNSSYINNVGAKMSGHRSYSSEIYPVPGEFIHNWNGFDYDQEFYLQIRDPENLDYRPHEGADIVDAGIPVDGITEEFLGENPDIGAYELGDSGYWIPGQQEQVASTPIPPDGAILAQKDQDLMWLFPYRIDTCDIYFGESIDAVENSDMNSKEFRSRQSG
ncbi:MAG: right-handed parallel beta-helix repeat-containing protein, partial [Bacteroidales bacterium]|nr:right-handed parallel beta-helix repeat-containing protein [Bacteroidales bacterium]